MSTHADRGATGEAGALRIEIVLDVTPAGVVAVDAVILHRKTDANPATKARMARLSPIVDEHMLALGRALGEAASGDTMEIVSHVRSSASDQRPPEPTPINRGGRA